MLIFPAKKTCVREIVRGPNIKPLPRFQETPDKLTGKVLLRVGDNVTTDDISPGGYKTLSLRSNIPEISKYTFQYVDLGFAERAIKYKGGFIVGGDNYGQGSSREHAALAVKCLGIEV